MVWAALCYNRQASQTFTSSRQKQYIKTLEENLLPFAGLGDPQWEFQQINAQIQIANNPKFGLILRILEFATGQHVAQF